MAPGPFFNLLIFFLKTKQKFLTVNGNLEFFLFRNGWNWCGLGGWNIAGIGIGPRRLAHHPLS